MRGACNDIGSTTTRPPLADVHHGRLAPVHQQWAFTRIAGGLGGGEAPFAAKIAEVATVLAARCAQAIRAGCGLGVGEGHG